MMEADGFLSQRFVMVGVLLLQQGALIIPDSLLIHVGQIQTLSLDEVDKPHHPVLI
jgi:hypothetical protein